MSSIPLAQVQTALGQLDQALYNHEQWSKSLARALIARLPADPPDLMPDAHRRCRFGQWYDSAAADPLRTHPTFMAMGQAHEQMHRLATGLLQRAGDGLPITPAAFDQFDNTLDRMRLEIQSLRRELAETMQNRDALTGARTRATLLADLREQQALVNRGVQACSLAMLDIDHFKRVNDQYGHMAGDAVLVAMTQCVQAHLRPYDRVYRYGGEEFLLCLPNTDLAAAADLAQRLRAAIAALTLKSGATEAGFQVTVSIGLAALDAGLMVEDCIDRADKALYAAKNGGRNCVMRWWDGAPVPAP